MSEKFGFKLNSPEDDNWDLYWADLSIDSDFVTKMKSHQKVNHFPNMNCLSRKDKLCMNLSRMLRFFDSEYDFFPKTWILPEDWSALRTEMCWNANATYIVKPEASSQGRGIFLIKSISNICSTERYVVQRYILNPYLIDGLKFDLRLYVLVYGCDPLRIYLFKEGLARLSTEK